MEINVQSERDWAKKSAQKIKTSKLWMEANLRQPGLRIEKQ